MKKAFTLLALLAATTSFGASFGWGTGTVAANFAGTTFSTADYNVTAYLVYLDSGSTSDLWTVDGDSITVASSVMTATPTITGAARNKGKINDTYEGSLANGQVYGMFIAYNDGEKQWYNFSSTTYTVSGYADATSTLSDAVFEFNFSSSAEVKSGEVSAGGGWQTVVVPEPATAALALLGIGMLIRRRKA